MKFPNKIFHENTTNGSQLVPCRQMARGDEADSHYSHIRKSEKRNWKTDFIHAENRAVGQEDEMYFESLSRSCL